MIECDGKCWNPSHKCRQCGRDTFSIVHGGFCHDWINDCPQCRRGASGPAAPNKDNPKLTPTSR